jgi:hypothetical protein
VPFSDLDFSYFLNALGQPSCASNLIKVDFSSSVWDVSKFIGVMKNPFLKSVLVEVHLTSMEEFAGVLNAWRQPVNYISEVRLNVSKIYAEDPNERTKLTMLRQMKDRLCKWKKIYLTQSMAETVCQYIFISRRDRNVIWENSILNLIFRFYFNDEAMRLYVVRHFQELSNAPDFSELKTQNEKKSCSLC